MDSSSLSAEWIGHVLPLVGGLTIGLAVPLMGCRMLMAWVRRTEAV